MAEKTNRSQAEQPDTHKLRGDTGRSDLIDARDLPKFDLHFEVLGALDEAASALGLVRAGGITEEAQDLILEIQHDMCWMMSELAYAGDVPDSNRKITPARLRALENVYEELIADHPLGSSFVIPGDSLAGAFVHLARAIVRRAERYVTLLDHEKPLANPNIIPYLNRLSTLLYALARAEEADTGIASPTTRAS